MAKISEIIYENEKILKSYHTELVLTNGERVHLRKRNKTKFDINTRIYKSGKVTWKIVKSTAKKSQTGLRLNKKSQTYWFDLWERCEPQEWSVMTRNEKFSQEEKKVLIELVLKNYGSRYVSKLRLS